MFHRRSILFLLTVLGLAGTGTAADGWAQLKKGMSLEEVLSALGAPLVKSQGRGIDLWIYDRGGETLASGGLLTDWTVPKPPSPPRKRDAAPGRPTGDEEAGAREDGAGKTELRLPAS